MPASTGVLAMTEKQYGDELQYQTTMHVMRRMLREGLISREEYGEIDTIFTQKYRPVFGTLLVGKELLFSANRANMDTERS